MSASQIFFDKAQHIGNREEQQDSFYIHECTVSSSAQSCPVLIVADGMGGMQGGKEAADLAISAVLGSLRHIENNACVQRALENAALHASESVYRMAERIGCAGETGATLLISVLRGDTLYWISVGDSRIYLLRDGVLQQLNVEHNLRNRLAALAAKGLFPIDDIENNPQKEALTSFIGIETLKEIDGANKQFQLQRGDQLLLCTDGLFKTLNAKEIISILLTAPREKIASALVSSTINRGMTHQDNVTVVYLQYGETGERERQEPVVAAVLKKTPAKTKKRAAVQVDIIRKKHPLLWMFFATVAGVCIASYQYFFANR